MSAVEISTVKVELPIFQTMWTDRLDEFKQSILDHKKEFAETTPDFNVNAGWRSNWVLHQTDPRFSDANEFAADELQGSSGLASYDELCSGGDIGYDRVDSHKGFVISAEAIVRMQSPAYETDPDEELGDRMCQKPYMVCP